MSRKGRLGRRPFLFQLIHCVIDPMHSKGNRRPGYYLGHDSFQVTGDGHGGQPFGCQPFSLQPPEPGCQLPMAEMPTPELPMPVPVTRHLKMYGPPANHPVPLCCPL